MNLEFTKYNLSRPGCPVPFSVRTLKGFTHGMIGAFQQGGERTAKWFRCLGSGPEGCNDNLQALTTTTPEEVAMAKQILTNKTDRQSKPPPKLTLELPLQGLPARSGVIDRELYNNIHRRITEKGKREGPVFSLRTDEALWAASEGDEMGLLVFNKKSKICKFFCPPDGFDLDALAEAAHQNIFLFLKGHVPYEFHDEMSDEIDNQADLLPDDKKKDVMSRALGELRIARKFSEALEGMIAEAAEAAEEGTVQGGAA